MVRSSATGRVDLCELASARLTQYNYCNYYLISSKGSEIIFFGYRYLEELCDAETFVYFKTLQGIYVFMNSLFGDTLSFYLYGMIRVI